MPARHKLRTQARRAAHAARRDRRQPNADLTADQRRNVARDIRAGIRKVERQR